MRRVALLFLFAGLAFGQITQGPPRGSTVSASPGCPAIQSVNQTCVTASPYFASGSSATTTTSGTTSPGTTVSVTSATSWVTGQGIYIAGAGVAGANYIGTVSAIAGTTFTISPATSTSVGSGALVQHDDTAAIQAAINAVVTAGGGTVYFPDGFYRVNGVLHDVSGANTVLTLPDIPILGAPGSAVPVSITFLGPSAPVTSSYEGVTTAGAIIQTSVSSGNLIGGFSATSALANMTFVQTIFQNLTFRAYGNPGVTMIDGTHIAEMVVRDTVFDTGEVGAPTAPTNTNGRALVLAGILNWITAVADKVQAVGYYDCITTGDHTHIGFAYAAMCQNGLVVLNADGAHSVDKIVLQDNINGITARAGIWTAPAPLVITEIDKQDAVPGIIGTPNADINDPGNLLVGTVNYWCSIGHSTCAFTVVGAQTLKITNITTAYLENSLQISSISPFNKTAGGSGFTLSVTGRGFTSNSAVRWNGAVRTTSLVNSTQLTASILSTDITSAGSALVAVTDSAKETANATFTVAAGAPPIALINHVAAYSPSGGAGVTSSSVDMTGANFLVANVAFFPTGCASPVVTDSLGNTWTPLTAYTTSTGVTIGTQMFYAANATVGSTQTFTVGCSGGNGFFALWVAGFSHVATVSPLDTSGGFATASTVASIQPGSTTPGNDNDLVVVGLAESDQSTLPTISAGFTIIDRSLDVSGDNFGGGLAYQVQGSATAVNPTWTWSTGTPAAANIATFHQ